MENARTSLPTQFVTSGKGIKEGTEARQGTASGIKMEKARIGKWIKIGISKEDRRKIYERLRIKSYNMLKNRHKREYSKILNSLIKKELRKIKNGNKENK